MDADSQDIQDVIAREKIRDCIARQARALDRRDGELLQSCYWPDAREDEGIFEGTAAQFLAWVVPGSPAVVLTQHILGQILISVNENAASVETHVTAYHRVDMGSEQRDVFLGGRYLDRMEKRNAEWRIIHRKLVYDWFKELGTSVDWSQGVLGMPFITERPFGKTTDDYSETLFK